MIAVNDDVKAATIKKEKKIYNIIEGNTKRIRRWEKVYIEIDRIANPENKVNFRNSKKEKK